MCGSEDRPRPGGVNLMELVAADPASALNWEGVGARQMRPNPFLLLGHNPGIQYNRRQTHRSKGVQAW